MPAGEFGAERVPQQLEQLDALLGLVAVGAAQILIEIGTDFRILEVARMAIEVDQPRRHRLLDEIFDAGIGHRRDDLIGIARVHVRQHVVADPRLGVLDHRVRQSPE